MRSTTGAHYLALDHVRALAAFLVVAWHFTHKSTGYPVPFEGAPLLPFAIIDEGHTGVALFMTLSGYLFAKLIGDRQIRIGAFLMNRALRLLPLLVFVICVVGVLEYLEGDSMLTYARRIAGGVLLPNLPNGGWSITVEAHFYVLLPLMLWSVRESKWLMLCLVLGAVATRALVFPNILLDQKLAYETIIGRFDQFALGMLMFYARHRIAGRHALAAIVAAAFLTFYWWFDSAGGFMQLGRHPSQSQVWVILPTLEGAAYGLLIAWYDGSFSPRPTEASRLLARFGELSYSIYLLHFFFVWHAADFVHRHVMDISNFYVALAWSAVFFGLMYVPAALSYRFIEKPALKLRRPYIVRAPAPEARGGADSAALVR